MPAASSGRTVLSGGSPESRGAGYTGRVQAAFERHKKGDLAWAEREYRRVLAEQPDHAAALHYLGLLAQQAGRRGEAVELLQRSIALDGTDARAHNHLGQVLVTLDRIEDAVRCFEAAVEADPRHVDSLNNLATALKKRGKRDRAIALYRRVLEIDPVSTAGLYNLANALRENGHYAQARELLERVVEIEPDHFRAQHNLAVLLEETGRFDEAAACYRNVLRVRPRHAKALANLLAMRSCAVDAGVISAAESRLADSGTGDDDRARLHQALGKQLDRAGKYDAAFRHFGAAKEIVKRRSGGFRVSATAAWFDRLVATFRPEHFTAARGSSSERPVFIVGMPRSGTTLTEQILASHPRVFAAGELRGIPSIVKELGPRFPEAVTVLDRSAVLKLSDRYLRDLERRAGPDAARVTDKLPFNFTHIGLIATLFPRARIIHCRRHPLDVALSCFIEHFEMHGDFTTDLRAIGEYLLQYERLMAHWRKVLPHGLLEQRYEDLVSDQEAGTRALLSWCGLEWDDACLEFQKTDRPILTPSRWQAKQTVYTSSVGRWRHYAAHLQPLRAMLADAGIELGGERPAPGFPEAAAHHLSTDCLLTRNIG